MECFVLLMGPDVPSGRQNRAQGLGANLPGIVLNIAEDGAIAAAGIGGSVLRGRGAALMCQGFCLLV